MSRSPAAWTSALLAAGLAVGTGSAFAADPDPSQASLQGLTTFRVVVEKLGSAVEKEAALRRQDLQADAETRLAQAGIPVSKRAPAVLYVNVSVVCHGPSCAFNIVLEVQQKVRLERRPRGKELTAPTWRTSMTGLSGREPDLIRQSLRDQVDQFVTAYRSANPAR